MAIFTQEYNIQLLFFIISNKNIEANSPKLSIVKYTKIKKRKKNLEDNANCHAFQTAGR